MKSYKNVLGYSLFLVLSACSSTSESFDSEPGQGFGAKSISAVNQMVDEIKSLNEAETNIKSPLYSENVVSDPQSTPLSDTMLIQRQGEEPLRLWVAPFQDQMENFHEGAVIYTIIRPSYWQISPNPYHI